MKSVFYAGAGIQSVLFFLNDGYLSATLACGSGVSPRTVRWGGTLLPQAVGRAMEWPATATTAASGGNRKLLLGQRPAGCECCSMHEASAGCRNPNSCPRRKLPTHRLTTHFFAGKRPAVSYQFTERRGRAKKVAFCSRLCHRMWIYYG